MRAHRRPAARGAEPAALRPRRRQQPVQAHRLPLPVHDRRNRRRVRPQPPARAHRRRATSPRTSTSATSRRSSATRPPSYATTDLSDRCRCTSNATTASALLTLDDPERRNALTSELVAEIVARDGRRSTPTPGVGAVVVTGAPPAFCSGADVQRARRDGVEARTTPATSATSTPGSCASSTAAAHGRGGERRRGRRRLQPRARLRRARSPARARASTPGSCASGSTPAAGTPGCSTAPSGRRPRRRWTCSASGSTATRAAAIGLAWECVADDELLDRALALAGRAAEVPRRAGDADEGHASSHRRGSTQHDDAHALRARPPGVVVPRANLRPRRRYRTRR